MGELPDVPVVGGQTPGGEDGGSKKRPTTQIALKSTGPVPTGLGRVVRSKTVILLLLVAAVALGTHLYLRHQQKQDPTRAENWSALVSSLQGQLKKGMEIIEEDEDLEYGDMPKLTGKAMIWSMKANRPSSFGVSSPGLARTVQEARLAIFIDMRWEKIGEYDDGTPRKQHVADVFVFDINGRMLNYAKRFLGTEPPADRGKTGVPLAGSSVEVELKNWLRATLNRL